MPGHARHGRQAASAAKAKQAAEEQGQGPPRLRQPGQGRPAGQAAEEKAAPAGNPFGNPDGEEIDYEKAAAALDLPKDFSKFLK